MGSFHQFRLKTFYPCFPYCRCFHRSKSALLKPMRETVYTGNPPNGSMSYKGLRYWPTFVCIEEGNNRYPHSCVCLWSNISCGYLLPETWRLYELSGTRSWRVQMLNLYWLKFVYFIEYTKVVRECMLFYVSSVAERERERLHTKKYSIFNFIVIFYQSIFIKCIQNYFLVYKRYMTQKYSLSVFYSISLSLFLSLSLSIPLFLIHSFTLFIALSLLSFFLSLSLINSGFTIPLVAYTLLRQIFLSLYLFLKFLSLYFSLSLSFFLSFSVLPSPTRCYVR